MFDEVKEEHDIVYGHSSYDVIQLRVP